MPFISQYRYKVNDTVEDKIQGIQNWANDRAMLDWLICNTEAFTSLSMSENYRLCKNCGTPSTLTIAEIVRSVQLCTDYTTVYANAERATEQAQTVATQCANIASFAHYEAMVTSLSIILKEKAKDIVSWLDSNEDYYESFMIDVPEESFTADIGAFIGSGVSTDCNQYATTAVTLTLKYVRVSERDTLFGLPFEIIELYPEISADKHIGTMVCARQNFENEIRTTANQSFDKCVRMFWAAKVHDFDVKYVPSKPTINNKRYPAKVVVSSSCTDAKRSYNYVAEYEESFVFARCKEVYDFSEFDFVFDDAESGEATSPQMDRDVQNFITNAFCASPTVQCTLLYDAQQTITPIVFQAIQMPGTAGYVEDLFDRAAYHIARKRMQTLTNKEYFLSLHFSHPCYIADGCYFSAIENRFNVSPDELLDMIIRDRKAEAVDAVRESGDDCTLDEMFEVEIDISTDFKQTLASGTVTPRLAYMEFAGQDIDI